MLAINDWLFNYNLKSGKSNTSGYIFIVDFRANLCRFCKDVLGLKKILKNIPFEYFLNIFAPVLEAETSCNHLGNAIL